MKISRQPLLLIASLAAAIASIPAPAADTSSERGVSVYDKQPQCTERRELKPGQTDPCEIQNGPPHRRVVGAGQSGASKPATGHGSGSTTSSQGATSSSGNMSQGGAQARR